MKDPLSEPPAYLASPVKGTASVDPDAIHSKSANSTSDTQEIDFDDPRVQAIIEAVALEKPWRWTIDYWLYALVRRWPVSISSFLFLYAHQMGLATLALTLPAVYADWRYIPRFAQDFRLSSKQYVAHVVRIKTIPSPIPKSSWPTIWRVSIAIGVAIMTTVIWVLFLADRIATAGNDRIAVLIIAGEIFAAGIFCLVICGYFWPVAPLDSGNRPPYSLHRTRRLVLAKLDITASEGPHSVLAPLSAARVLTAASALLVVLPFAFQYGGERMGLAQAIRLELLLQPLLFFGIGFVFIPFSNALKMRAIARAFVGRLRAGNAF